MSQHRNQPTSHQEHLTISRPNAGQHINLPSAQQLQLGFDTGSASFDRSGNDLAISLDNGSQVTIKDFFSAEQGPLPHFVLSDGITVPAGQFLAAASPEMDLTLAAGPTSPTNKSNGVGEYADTTGDLLSGVDRLGTLGTDYWTNHQKPAEPVESPLLRPTDIARDTVDNAPAPSPSSQTYHTRAVLYAHDAKNATPGTDNPHTVTAKALQNLGNGWEEANTPPSVLYERGEDATYVKVTVQADGSILFALTQAGLEYLLLSGKEFLDLYFKVQLPGSPAYVVQVIITDNKYFNSQELDQQTPENSDCWGSLANGGLIHGEWHQGTSGNDSSYNITASDQADRLDFSGGILNSTIKTGYAPTGAWGADTLNITGQIIADQGDSSIEVRGADSSVSIISSENDASILARNGSSNVVRVDGNNSTLSILSQSSDTAYGLHSYNANTTQPISSNTVYADSLELTVIGERTAAGIVSESGGSNTLTLGPGLNAIAATAQNGKAYGIQTGLDTGLQSGEPQQAQNAFINITSKGNLTIAANGAEKSIGIYTESLSGAEHQRPPAHTPTIDSITNIEVGGELRVAAAGDGYVSGILNHSMPADWYYGQEGWKNEVLTHKSEQHIKAETLVVSAEGGASATEVHGIDVSGFDPNGGNFIRIQNTLTHALTTITANEVQVAANKRRWLGEEAKADAADWASFENTSYGIAARGSTGLHINTSALDVFAAGKEAIAINSISNSGGPTNPSMQAKDFVYGIHIKGTDDTSNTFNFMARSTVGTAWGSYAPDGSYTTIEGKTNSFDSLHMDIKAVETGNAFGITTGYFQEADPWGPGQACSGQTVIRHIDKVTLNVETSQANAFGIVSTSPGSLTGGAPGNQPRTQTRIENDGTLHFELNVTANSSGLGAGGYATGIVAAGSGINQIKGGTGSGIEVNASTPKGQAVGIYANGGGNYLNASDGTIAISAHTVTGGTGNAKNAYAVAATAGGLNQLQGATISIQADAGAAGDAYGLHAKSNARVASSNSIQAESTVKVIATASIGDATAMFAEGTGRNEIKGTGNNNMEVTLLAKGASPDSSFVMRASGKGVNLIKTGSGDDTVLLTGKVTSDGMGKNEILTGAGDDIITINGAITGSFHLDGGSGYDLLTLQGASNADDFYAMYGAWLSENNSLEGIEAIRFDGLSYTDVLSNAQLLSLYQNLESKGITVIFDHLSDAGIVFGEAAATAHTSYTGDFLQHMDLTGQDTIVFNNGADRLYFQSGLSNGSLNMGAGNDLVSIEQNLTNISVDLGSGNDHLYLGGKLEGNVKLTGGEGVDVLHLHTQSHISLNDLNGHNGNELSGFEILDLTGGDGTRLDIDQLLSSLNIDSPLQGGDLDGQLALRILGDTSDSLSLGTSWSDAVVQTITYDSIDYNVYQNSQGEYLLVQAGIVVTI